MAQFVGVIHKEGKSDFGVSFPDFPGCITAGRTMQEAYGMAKEALEGHVRAMREFGERLPKKAMGLDEAAAHACAKGAASFFLMDIEVPARKMRVNIMLDECLIKQIDAVSDNRSAFLADAARERLGGA